MSGWERLGAVKPEALHGARIALHYAAQLASAPGTSWIEAREDFSHTNLHWDKTAHALAGEAIGGHSAALRLADMTLCVLDASSAAVAELPLAGQTMGQGLLWLAETMGDKLQERGALKLPEHDMPDSPFGKGEPLTIPDASHAAELSHYFANAAQLIGTVQKEHSSAPVRCWPHHFDIATLITLDKDKSGEEARSVGVGLSPGDGGYDLPYIYVTPWPYPPAGTALPELSLGGWHTEGWTGAVLQSSELVGAQEQAQAAERFMREALSACLSLLNR